MITRMNQTNLAKKLGISKAQVCALAKRGMPLDTVEAAQAWRTDNIDPARRKGQRFDQYRVAEPSAQIGVYGETFDQARRREKIAAANLAEIEEAALRGKYLDRADFERYLFNAGRMLRDGLTNCARRISAEVSALATAQDCEAVIDREHRAALASFSRELRTTIQISIDVNPLNAEPPK